MANFKKLSLKKIFFGVFLASLPVLLQSNSLNAGPGKDSAFADNKAMCSLPPFLNVAVTDRPNIMVLYANTLSMSLAAYTKPYDQDKHYYGIFDADACYTSGGKGFEKSPEYPVDTVKNTAGVWIANPVLNLSEPGSLHPLTARQHGDPKQEREPAGEDNLGAHRCNAGRFSGNFLNWATMRRIDLLRKAFSGGLSANAGNQETQWVGGEGVQSGGTPFAPCFSKSYAGTGVSPYGINQLKVVNGQVQWGQQCNTWEETITARLELPDLDGGVLASNTNGSFGPILNNMSYHPAPKKSTVVSAIAEAKHAGFGPLDRAPADFDGGKLPIPTPEVIAKIKQTPPRPVQLASLWNTMIDIGQALFQATPAYFDITATPIELKTIDAASSYNGSTSNGYWGDTFQVTFEATNTGGETATYAYVYVNLNFGGYSRWFWFNNSDCFVNGSNLATNNKWNVGQTKKMTCRGQELPIFGSNPAQPSVRIYVYPNGQYSEDALFVNDGIQVAPQFNVHGVSKPDASLWINNYDLKAGMVGMPVKFQVTVNNNSPTTALPAGTPVSIGWQATSGGVITNGSVVGTCVTPVDIPANSSTQLECTVRVPSVGAGARYNLVATVSPTDDLFTSNNSYTWHNGFWVHKNNSADLQATAIRELGGATVGIPGAEYWVEVEIVNVGNRAFTNGGTNEGLIVLSNDSTYTPGDLNLNDTSVDCDVPSLKVYPDPEYRKTFNCKIKIPESINPADYAWGHLAFIVQSINVSPAESPDEGPNSVGTYFPIEYSNPKLSIDSLSPDQTTGLAIGDKITVWTTIRNDGKGTTFSGIRFYWSKDNVLDASDQVLATTDESAWSGDSCTLSKYIGNGGWGYGLCSVKVPLLTNGLPTLNGSYYVIVRIDPNKTASPAEGPLPQEHNNNIQSFPVYVGIAPPQPDLLISNVKLPMETGPGQLLEVSMHIVNNGAAATVTWPTVTVTFIGDGGNNTSTCTYPGNLNGFGDYGYLKCSVLVPGDASATPTPVPSVTAGDPPLSYKVKIEVDPANSIVEADETNNTASGSVLVRALSACSTGCDYTIKANFSGRGRVGLLWSFRAKATGAKAPANLGVTIFDDWKSGYAGTEPWGINGVKFKGVETNQLTANDIIPHLESAVPRANGSLARMLLNVIKYYAHTPNFEGKGPDPFLYNPDGANKPHPCRKNYILMITDGYSFNDWNVLPPGTPNNTGVTDLRLFQSNFTDQVSPEPMLDTENYLQKVPTGGIPAIVDVSGGSYHLDNVARYGRQEDIREDGVFAGTTQNVHTLFVHAFAQNDVSAAQAERATRLLKAAAIQGSYTDKDAIPGPNREDEWNSDRDPNKTPDGYFPATEDKDVGQVILEALQSILLKTASGTSVSVIASTARGEGAVYQSYFRPSTATTTSEGLTEVNWLGFLQALWVDKNGVLREDTDGDKALHMKKDFAICMWFNRNSNETLARRFRDDGGDGIQMKADCSDIPGETRIGDWIALSSLRPVFETGRILWERDAVDRTIYTWPHPPGESSPSAAYPAVEFSDTNVATLQNYLWPAGNVYATGGLYESEGVTAATNLINWTRGEQIADDLTFRNRLMTIEGETKPWKLGDIVYSTPTIVGPPEERYDLVYGGKANGYSQFFVNNRERRRLVVVGANDGMIHAFNGGFFKEGASPSTPGSAAWFDEGGMTLGQEVWAYIPGALLPNLRILADAAYDTGCHIYSVDLKPKVTDVQIFFDASGDPVVDPIVVNGETKNRYHNGWGTVLIGGMRLGCGKIEFSSYFVLDITNPDHPTVLAEFGPSTSSPSALDKGGAVTNLNALNFSYFYPIVMRAEDSSVTAKDSNGTSFSPGRWTLVVATGPDDVRFVTAKDPAVYVFDLNQMAQRSGTSPGGFGRTGSALTSRTLDDYTHAIVEFSDGTKLTPGTVVSNGLTADMDGDFKVDAAYLVTQIDRATLSPAGRRLWGSEVWRLNPTYNDAMKTQLTSPRQWPITKVFTTGTAYRQPAVGQPSITRDNFNNIWLYFGTGRFLHRSADTEIDDLRYGSAYKQSLYGIIDPCWGGGTTSALGVSCSYPLTRTNLLDVTKMDTYIDESDGLVKVDDCVGASGDCKIGELAERVRNGALGAGTKLGWVRDMYRDPAEGEKEWETVVNAKGEAEAVESTEIRVYCPQDGSMVDTCEMAYTKPAVAGGLVLFTTYTPGYAASSGTCTLSGRSHLYALNFATGVASGENVFNSVQGLGSGRVKLPHSIPIGQEPPSAPSIFGKSVFVQGSNANITRIQVDAQFRLPPHARGWQEQ